MPTSIEFWFDFASTYSYVAALRIESLCDVAGLNLTWKPFLLGPLFTEQLGIQDSPFNANPIRGAFLANFAEDLEIADPLILADLLEMQGSHPKEILERAISPENKIRLRA